MDPLEKELLLRDLGSYGYQLVQPDIDRTKVLHRMLASDDGRILEGVPVVLTNMIHHSDPIDLEAVEKTLPQKLQRRFRILVAFTLLHLFLIPDGKDTEKLVSRYLAKREPSLVQSVQERLRHRQPINVGGGISLDPDRLENTYKLYVVTQFMAEQKSITKRVDEKRQIAFQESISTLFTAKQAELLLKMLNNEPLSKTEREYYSRVIKTRLKALSNADLQSVATTLLGR